MNIKGIIAVFLLCTICGKSLVSNPGMLDVLPGSEHLTIVKPSCKNPKYKDAVKDQFSDDTQQNIQDPYCLWITSFEIYEEDLPFAELGIWKKFHYQVSVTSTYIRNVHAPPRL